MRKTFSLLTATLSWYQSWCQSEWQTRAARVACSRPWSFLPLFVFSDLKDNRYVFYVAEACGSRTHHEPTIRPAKDRITGFEGRESHRTLFASANSIAWER